MFLESTDGLPSGQVDDKSLAKVCGGRNPEFLLGGSNLRCGCGGPGAAPPSE